MCGICGIVGFADVELVTQMRDLLTYRGPDEAGLYRGDHAVLGVRRLSIIDPDGGQQPLFNEDGSVVVVCNGEIYNHRSLRQELEHAGHTFTTHTDAEVLVHLYEEHGAACVQYLHGMFAFALWDVPQQRLLLGRDPLGIKPLFYCQREHCLAFASEMKALCLWDAVERRLNYQAVDALLTYFCIPGAATLLDGIQKLPPGHILIFEAGQGKLQQYWQPSLYASPARSRQWYANELRQVLTAAVESHLMSDVPLGATLSGGIDSGAIVGLMSQLSAQPVQTFTIGLGAADEELQYARLMAERFRTDHHEIIADLGDFATDLPRIVWHLENPVPSSIIPTFYLAKHIYPAVKVILVGEGGDELFAGYRRFKAFSAPAALLPERLRSWAYWQGWHAWNPAEKRQLYTDSFRQQVPDGVGGRPQFEQVFAGTGGSALNRALLFEQAHELSEIQLWRIDRLTSAFSLEARVPFLDLRVVELANTIPARYKLKGFQEKYILRQAMASLLPEAILRRPKRGLGAPFRAWFSHGLREMATDYLAAHRIHDRDYFQSQTIQRLFHPRSGRFAARRYGTRLFVLLLFEIWCQQFLDHHPARPRLDNSVLSLGAS